MHMAITPEILDENKIIFLANEVAKTYMANKTMIDSAEEFTREYMIAYKTARKTIYEMEMEEKRAREPLLYHLRILKI